MLSNIPAERQKTETEIEIQRETETKMQRKTERGRRKKISETQNNFQKGNK